MTVDLPRSEGCFLCGFANPHGLNVQMRIENKGTADEAVVADFTPTEHHQGYRGIMHGGISATLLDEVMGWAPAYRRRRLCMAVQLSFRYIKPVPVGTCLKISGRVVDDTRKLWTVKGVIEDGDGTVYVKAEGKFFPLSEDQSRQADEVELVYEPGQERIFSQEG